MKLFYVEVFLLGVLCLTVCTCSSTTVKGLRGQNITLPCMYDWHYHGKCEICWMKGKIPILGCGDEIIATDGDVVIRQTSDRYQLNGELQKGNVALTILDARQKDSGKYGCRVHVQGLFNDIKTEVNLVVLEEVFSSTPETVTMDPRQSETQDTKDVNTIRYSNTSGPEYDKTVKKNSLDSFPVTMVSVILILLLLGTATIYVVWKRKRRNRVLLELTQNANSSAIYNNSEISLGLRNARVALENVYQFDNERENVYEQWS